VRPVKLQIEGFTAYRTLNTIDFDGAQLLVFSGPNGAGKSSLLDAMIFALFGNIPRMKGKQIREFISQGKDKFKILFQFSLNDKMYRVERSYFLKGTPLVRLQVEENGNWKTISDKVKETDEMIAGLLQLGYDAFIKSVILPQNLFDQFLKGDKEKRREVLTEILNLELFEKISKLAGEKSAAFKLQIQQKEENLREISQVVSPEQQSFLQQQLGICQKQKEDLSLKRSELDRKKQELLDLGKWFEEKERLEREKSAFLEEKEEWSKKEEELNTFKKLFPFSADLALLKEKKERHLKLNDEILRLTKLIDDLEKTSHKMEIKLNELNLREQSEIVDLKERLILLHGLKEPLSDLEKNSREKEVKMGELGKLSSNLQPLEVSQTASLKEKADIEAEILKLQGFIQELVRSHERFSIYAELYDSLKELGSLEKEIAKASSEKKDLESEIASLGQSFSKLESEKAGLEKEIGLLEKTVESLKVQDLSRQLQKSLKIGDSCPVCLQKVLSLPQPAFSEKLVEEFESQNEKLNKMRIEREKLLNEEAKLQERGSRKKADLGKLERELAEKTDQKIRLEKELSDRLNLPLENFLDSARKEYQKLQEDEKKYQESLEAEKGLSSRLNQLILKFQEQESLMFQMKQKKAVLADSIEKLERDIQEKRGRIKAAGLNDLSLRTLGEILKFQEQESLMFQMKQKKAVLADSIEKLERDIQEKREKIKAAGLNDLSLRTLGEKIAQLENQERVFRKEKEEVSSLYQETKGKLDAARSQKKEMENKAAEELRTLETLKNILQNNLLEIGFSSLEDIPSVDPGSLAKLEEELNQYHVRFSLVTEKLAEAFQKIGSRTYHPDLIKQIDAEIASLKDEEERLQAEIGKLQHQLQELDLLKEKIVSLQGLIQSLRSQESLYVTIHQDLRKDRLPDYLLSSVLHTILESASEKYYELSGKRYKLSLEGTGEIQVLDGWNMDEPRSVTSLSGGESFAASLSVALALSEYLQGRQRIQSLFIDEGFGHLDKETRDKVAEILSSLQTGERLVGIVTHIEELADLFPHRIIVEKLPEGSRILQSAGS
jgi:exonuclease SbcC